MRVTINGYGLVEFKPTELYRFDGRENSTQLRGQVRIQRPDLDIRTTCGEEWIDYNFWFTLNQVIIDSVDDLNLMVGLKAVTDLAVPTIKETYTGINGARFNIPHLKIQLEQGSIIYPRQNKRARCKVDGDGYVLLVKDTFLPKHYLGPDVEWVLEGSEVDNTQNTTPTNFSDGEVAANIILDEQIGETIASMKILNKNDPDELRMYSELLSVYNRLTDLQKRK